MQNLLWFQFAEESDSKNGEQKSNSTVQIEDDGPSETFKDEETKVSAYYLFKDYVSESNQTNKIAMHLSSSWIIQCNTPDDEAGQPNKEEIFKNRLRKELVSRDGHGYVRLSL